MFYNQSLSIYFSGVKAGLSTGREVRKEMEAKKRREDEMFSKVNNRTKYFPLLHKC